MSRRSSANSFGSGFCSLACDVVAAQLGIGVCRRGAERGERRVFWSGRVVCVGF